MMELASTDLAALVRVSASIPRAAPRALAQLTACLVVPLSVAMLAPHSLSTDPILLLLGVQQGFGVTYPEWLWLLRLLAYQCLYLIVLYTFAVLSTAATVFTVASLYANNKPPASMSSSFAALPDVLPNLLDTFALAPLALAYQVFALTVFGLIAVFVPNAYESDAGPPPLPMSFLLFVTVLGVVFLGIHVYISTQWHLASVISVLEPPLCGLAAMAKSKRLLQGRTGTAVTLVVCYLAVCGAASLLFRAAVVDGSFGLALPGRLLVGAGLLCLVVCVNLLGLLVQTVFYYACKACHNL